MTLTNVYVTSVLPTISLGVVTSDYLDGPPDWRDIYMAVQKAICRDHVLTFMQDCRLIHYPMSPTSSGTKVKIDQLAASSGDSGIWTTDSPPSQGHHPTTRGSWQSRHGSGKRLNTVLKFIAIRGGQLGVYREICPKKLCSIM